MVSIEQAGRTDLEQNDEKEAHAPRELSPAAQRALAEAEARREALRSETLPPERGGRGGKEPVRYGDWEVKGLAVDF